jgi:hypothetical protein
MILIKIWITSTKSVPRFSKQVMVENKNHSLWHHVWIKIKFDCTFLSTIIFYFQNNVVETSPKYSIAQWALPCYDMLNFALFILRSFSVDFAFMWFISIPILCITREPCFPDSFITNFIIIIIIIKMFNKQLVMSVSQRVTKLCILKNNNHSQISVYYTWFLKARDYSEDIKFTVKVIFFRKIFLILLPV